MKTSNPVYRAVHKAGGPTVVALALKCSTQTIHRWIQNSCVPNFHKAKALARLSGFDLNELRPSIPGILF